jgi:hypothetical protein
MPCSRLFPSLGVPVTFIHCFLLSFPLSVVVLAFVLLSGLLSVRILVMLLINLCFGTLVCLEWFLIWLTLELLGFSVLLVINLILVIIEY